MRALAISTITATPITTPTTKIPPERLPMFLEIVLEEVGAAVVTLAVECVSLVVLPSTAVLSMVTFTEVIIGILLVLLISILLVSVMTERETEVTLKSVGINWSE